MKLCVIPGQETIRLATTQGGHSILIGETLTEVPDHFVREARSRGAISHEELAALKKKLKSGEPGEDTGPGAPAPVHANDTMLEQVTAAVIDVINRADAADFETESGKPTTQALTALCGFEVGGELRDQAYEGVAKVTA